MTLLLGAVVLGLSNLACSATTRKAPVLPAKQAVKERTLEERERQQNFPHVAPPPAYGNKVVLANREARERSF